jgi:large subunit ribosomal protein L10
MSMTRQNKETQVEALRESFSRATASVFLDFRGLTVPAITSLRERFREAGVQYRVVKNNLVWKALSGTPLDGNKELDPYLKGPTGIAWSFEDPSAAAKIVKKFRSEGEENEKLKVKCGLLESQVLSGERVESELATLPGKDELRARLLAQLQAPAQGLARQLLAAGQNFAYLLDARKRQLEEG